MRNVFGKTALSLAIGLTAMVGGAFAAEQIKLGSIYSLTGSYAVIEDPALKGAKLAVKEGELREQQRTLERLRTDPDFVEKIIRQRLGYAKPGDLIFRFDPSP